MKSRNPTGNFRPCSASDGAPGRSMTTPMTTEQFRAQYGDKAPRGVRRNKYGVAAKERRTWNGRVYASRAEMLYDFIGLYPARFDGWAILHQWPVALGPAGIRTIVDFRLARDHKEDRFVEVKGVQTPAFRLKCKLWRVYGPGPLEIVKVRESRTGRVTCETIDTIVPGEKARRKKRGA